MGRAAVLALAIAAMATLAGCIAPLPCVNAGPLGSAAYQACMQADYAQAMREMDYTASLQLRNRQ